MGPASCPACYTVRCILRPPPFPVEACGPTVMKQRSEGMLAGVEAAGGILAAVEAAPCKQPKNPRIHRMGGDERELMGY